MIEREDGEVHRVADVAVGAADDETVGRSHRGRRTDPLDDEPREGLQQNDSAGQAEQDPEDPEHSPPRSAALDLPTGQPATGSSNAVPPGARTRKTRCPMAARTRERPHRPGCLLAQERVASAAMTASSSTSRR